MSGYSTTRGNANVERDQQIDSTSRLLLKSEPYLLQLSQKSPSRALKEAIRAAARVVDGKPHGLPPI